ncbi:MAG: PKD domain-containing protein [Bacteroidota bacterium]
MYRLLLLFLFYIHSQIGNAQTADFTFSGTNASCSSTVVQFTQKCTGNPVGYIWNIGAKKQVDPNPVEIFSSPGTYKITLTAVYEKTTASISKIITIFPEANAQIGYDRNSLCKPGIVNFEGISNSNITAYTWDFGDSTPVITTPNFNVAHNFTGYGKFNVLLSVKTINGCIANAKTTVTIQPVGLTASSSRLTGCIPANVRFTAVVSAPEKSPVSNYAWDFNDGSSIVNTSGRIVNKTYSTAGIYQPSLTVTTSDGCIANFVFAPHSYGTPPPKLPLQVAKPVICASENAMFITNASIANLYRWEFGDGSSQNLPDTLVAHKYNVLGNQVVKVTPYYNGCAGLSSTNNLKVEGVVAKFNYANTCLDKKTYAFTNTSIGNITGIVWSFNNVAPDLTTTNAVVSFPGTGAFRVTLKETDSITGCKSDITKIIYTANPKIVNPDSFVCRNTTSNFFVENNYTAKNITYQWQVLGRKFLNDSAILAPKGDTLGQFSNAVIIKYDQFSCPDTVLLDHSITVSGPQLDFKIPANICFGNMLEVVNLSKSFIPSDSINSWRWKFDFNTNLVDTTYHPQAYRHTKNGNYSLTLFADDNKGCSDSLVKKYAVTRIPFLHIQKQTDTVCLGNPTTYIAFHSDSLRWSPTNIFACSNCDTVTINPVKTMQIYATATSAFNCVSNDSIQIRVFEPFTAQAPIDQYVICEKETIQLNVLPANKKIAWAPATGLSAPNIYLPAASPSQPTIYTATVSDSANCFSSTTSINVIVKRQPAVDAGPDLLLAYNDSYAFAPTYSSNISSYQWTPFENIDCNNCAVPKGVALETKTYRVKVVSDSGCIAFDSVHVGLRCSNASMFMATAFSPNNDNLNDYYYPLLKGVKSIKRFAVFNRFGQMIFEVKNFPSNNKAFGWNGKFNGRDQPSSTYLYVLDAVCDLGEMISKHGSFILMR